MFPWASVAKAAAIGAGVALVGGKVTGLVSYVKSKPSDESQKARALAESLSEGLNATAFFAIIAVPAAIAVAVVRSRAR
jgi:biopolymer transport protein ExbB/TolQ